MPKPTDKTTYQPLVSIAIDNYNYGRFLPQAIESSLNQTYARVEVIVVDDGSTDNSCEVIRSYGARVVPVFKENGGQASAMNAGFAACSGDIIVFLDSDDFLLPHCVEKVVSVWRPGLAKVQYWLRVVGPNGNWGDNTIRRRILPSGDMRKPLLERGYYLSAGLGGSAFSRPALQQVIPIPEEDFRNLGDQYLMVSIPFYGEVLSIQEELACYRSHGGNQWAGSAYKPENLARPVRMTQKRSKALATTARRMGFEVPHDLDRRNASDLKFRLASLKLMPDQHPVAGDQVLKLCRDGVRAVWKYWDDLDTPRRLAWSLWFLMVALSPSFVARALYVWTFLPETRPRLLRPLFRRVG